MKKHLLYKKSLTIRLMRILIFETTVQVISGRISVSFPSILVMNIFPLKIIFIHQPSSLNILALGTDFHHMCECITIYGSQTQGITHFGLSCPYLGPKPNLLFPRPANQHNAFWWQNDWNFFKLKCTKKDLSVVTCIVVSEEKKVLFYNTFPYEKFHRLAIQHI